MSSRASYPIGVAPSRQAGYYYNNRRSNNTNKPASSRCPAGVGILITFASLGLLGYVIWEALGRPSPNELLDQVGLGDIDIDFGDFTDVLGNLSDIGNFGDIWTSEPDFFSANETNRWDNGNRNQGGLELTLWNALDENWQEEFKIAVDDWENGNPDTLTLPVERVDVDHTCDKQVDGLMKVCNGNYGKTGWLGINQFMTVRGGIITSSIAKMNEYYLFNADFDERRYTMCHEIGHGFGLEHTDTNFYNADLGNCLDYTNFPSNNLLPGLINYERLAALYGEVNSGSRRSRRHGRRQEQQRQQNLRSIEEDKEEKGYRISIHNHTNNNDNNSPRIPNHISPKVHEMFNDAINELHNHMLKQNSNDSNSNNDDNNHHDHGWRLLEKHPKGARYSKNLIDGYKAEVHVLFATTT